MTRDRISIFIYVKVLIGFIHKIHGVVEALIGIKLKSTPLLNRLRDQ